MPDNGMQRTALRAAADVERSAMTFETPQESVMIVRKAVALCVVAVLMSAALEASAQDFVDQLRIIERERLRSLVDADMEVARTLHADDFQLINPLGGAVSKNEYLGQIESGDIDYLEWEPEEIEVKQYGDAAVIRYRARLRIMVRGMPEAPSGRFWHTDMYERRDGQWQVVWSQATQIQP